MQDLITLGGPDFAAEIVGQFVSDGARILKDITASIATQDGATFREQAHTLRPCAANVGARGIYEMCLEWREADDRNLAEFGSEYARRLQENFETTSAVLQDRYATGTGAKPGRDTPSAASG